MFGSAKLCKTCLAASIAFGGVVLPGGCAKDRKTAHQSQKELAAKQWAATRASVLYGLARDQYAAGNLDESRTTLSEAVRLDPESAKARVLSARIAVEQGQLELAVGELDAARKLDPKDADADYLSGVIYQRWQKPETAYTFYKAASDKSPGELSYLLAKAEMLVSMNRPAEALEVLQGRVVYFEHSAPLRDAVGQLLAGAGRYADAVEMLRQASILNPDDAGIREHLALSTYYAGQFRDAADAIARLLGTAEYAKRADLHLALGECQLQAGNVRAARQSFEAAATLDPASTGAWLSLAKATLAQDDLRRADQALRKAVALEPGSAETQLMLGYVRVRQGNLPDGLAAFRRASAIDPADTVSLCMIGFALERLGKPADAARCYGQALRIKPGDEMASKMMATVDLRE